MFPSLFQERHWSLRWAFSSKLRHKVSLSGPDGEGHPSDTFQCHSRAAVHSGPSWKVCFFLTKNFLLLFTIFFRLFIINNVWFPFVLLFFNLDFFAGRKVCKTRKTFRRRLPTWPIPTRPPWRGTGSWCTAPRAWRSVYFCKVLQMGWRKKFGFRRSKWLGNLFHLNRRRRRPLWKHEVFPVNGRIPRTGPDFPRLRPGRSVRQAAYSTVVVWVAEHSLSLPQSGEFVEATDAGRSQPDGPSGTAQSACRNFRRYHQVWQLDQLSQE